MQSRPSHLPPVSRLAIGWFLMIPLIFYAVNGSPRLDTYSRNNEMEASYTSLVPSSGGPLPMIEKAIAIICITLICNKLSPILAIARENKALCTLVLLALTSIAWSQFPMDSLRFGSFSAVNMAFAFYIAATFSPRRQMQLFVMLGWILLFTSTLVAVGFPQYGLDRQGGGVIGAWIGVFPHKNWLAIMSLFLLTSAFYTRPSTSTGKLWNWLYIVASVGVVGLSQSRTGWLVAGGLLLYVVCTSILKRYRTQDLYFFIFLSVGLFIAAGALFLKYSTAFLLLIGKDPTLTGRTRIWELSWLSILKRPLLGYGYRAFWHGLQGESANVSLADRWIVPAAHNGFLDLWLGLGAVGLGLFLYSVIRAVLNAMYCLRRSTNKMAEWYLCIIVLTVMSNVAELTLMVPEYLAWMMYIIACVGLAEEARRARLGCRHE